MEIENNNNNNLQSFNYSEDIINKLQQIQEQAKQLTNINTTQTDLINENEMKYEQEQREYEKEMNEEINQE